MREHPSAIEIYATSVIPIIPILIETVSKILDNFNQYG